MSFNSCLVWIWQEFSVFNIYHKKKQEEMKIFNNQFEVTGDIF